MRDALEAEEGPVHQQHEHGLSDVLHRVVEEVRQAISRDVSGAELLHNLLSAPWLHALLKVYECLLQFRTLLPSPVLPDASSLSYEVLLSLSAVPSPSAEARELFSLLSSPHLQALLSAHDTVAQSDYEPVLPPLPDDLPQDEEAMRIVCLVKNKQPLGATIKKDEDTGEIFIARVINGGLADRSGLLHAGDLLVEVNGSPVEGLDPEQVIQILIQSEGTILFKVIPNTPRSTNSQTMLRVRAMADYCPQQDPAIPCPDAGMAFSKGDLLEIVDQTDIHWWQARKLPSITSCAGLIPSTSLLKSKQREQWWCQPFQAHTCSKPCVKMPDDGKEEDTKDADDKCIKMRKILILVEDLREEEAESESSVDGIYTAGFRRSFRMWRRTAFRKRRQSCYSCSPNSRVLTNPYEEVMTYQRPPQDPHRLIVLVGASGVGVNEMRKRLITLNPTTFQGPVPHTTRPPKDGEEPGREYNFITKELFEDMISNHKFLEHGEYKGYSYGTSSDVVKDVLSSGKMCLVDVEPHNVQSLRTRDLKPYVILVKPPGTERLKLTRREAHAHIITNYNANRPFTDEDFAEMEVTTKLIESKFGQFFDSVVVNDELQDSCMQLFTTILQAQDEAQWVPAGWMSPEEP
ncbi:MAGUK p55 subfamily member 4 [Osmerus mordax]|uniref:MAGUK p55 subfamily member 4 n=1 Tax=Osmerus mordax TaxID=8014 RepID=UPI00350F9E9F